jgi:cyclomaltodextrinase
MMDDFIFGTLADDEKRLAYLRAAWEGVTHRQARSPRDPAPEAPINLALMAGPAYAGERAWVYWTTDGSDPQGERGVATNGSATPLVRMGEEWNVLLWDYQRRFAITLPGQPAGTVLRYRLSIEAPQGEVFADGGAYYACYIADDPPPAWAQDAVIYHIFADRFFPGAGCTWAHPADPTGFYGGTLRGIVEKMDYLSGLDVNVLYLSPVFPSPSHHGYDSTELFDVEPRLGTRADLRELLDEAHRRGMRVILDYVPNHISNEHSIFRQAASDPHSPYRDWFTFTHWPDQYASFFGVRSLPQVNLRYPPARDYMLDVARHWLAFGVDGYRVDYAIGPTPDFWAEFRRVTRMARPDCWTFGEVVDPPDAQLAFEGGLDGCLDFLLLEGLRQAFAFSRWDAAHLAAFIDRHEAYFPPTFTRPSFLDNHDMNRFLWAAEGDVRRLKLAALCQFSLIGSPIIYYGTEVGLSQQRDVRQAGFGRPHESRLPMLWGGEQDAGLHDYYRQLIALRHAHPALRRGVRETLYVDAHVYILSRLEPGSGGERVTTALNLAHESLQVRLPRALGRVLIATDDGCRAHQEGDLTVLSLSPLGGVMLGSPTREMDAGQNT